MSIHVLKSTGYAMVSIMPLSLITFNGDVELAF